MYMNLYWANTIACTSMNQLNNVNVASDCCQKSSHKTQWREKDKQTFVYRMCHNEIEANGTLTSDFICLKNSESFDR